MPQWAGSCWYYLRYLQPWNNSCVVDPDVEKYWLPVDLYVGKFLCPFGGKYHGKTLQAIVARCHSVCCLVA